MIGYHLSQRPHTNIELLRLIASECDFRTLFHQQQRKPECQAVSPMHRDATTMNVLQHRSNFLVNTAYPNIVVFIAKYLALPDTGIGETCQRLTKIGFEFRVHQQNVNGAINGFDDLFELFLVVNLDAPDNVIKFLLNKSGYRGPSNWLGSCNNVKNTMPPLLFCGGLDLLGDLLNSRSK